VAELEPAKVLEKRTRGSSEVVSPHKKKIQNQPKKPSRKLVLSKYTEEEDIVQDSSSLIARTMRAKVVEKFKEISSELQSEVVSEGHGC